MTAPEGSYGIPETPPAAAPTAATGGQRKRRSKDIGTAAETAVVRYLQANGFPHAERRALHGYYDLGDVTGIPGVVIEVKGGQAAKTASDGQVSMWLEETEVERRNAGADFGVLVLQRPGIGPANAGRWWAVVQLDDVFNLSGHIRGSLDIPVRSHLADVATFLRDAGYGDPLDEETA